MPCGSGLRLFASLLGWLLLSSLTTPLWAQSQRLEVVTVPRDATISILNIKPVFQQGMRLAPGRYHLDISRRGYQPQRQWITIAKRPVTLRVELEPYRYELFVDTRPQQATIKIWNIKPVFQQGIELTPGRYDLEVSAAGYQPYRQWIEIEDSARRLQVDLQPLSPEQAPGSSFAAALERSYQVYISTQPPEAQIRFIEPERPFHQNMHLPPGRYQLEVSHPGYRTLQQVLEISDADVHWDARLISEDARFALFIDTWPEDAAIRFGDTERVYRAGMLLAPGRYPLRVSHPDYLERRDWVDISHHDVSLSLRLSPPPRCFADAEHKARLRLVFYADTVQADYQDDATALRLFGPRHPSRMALYTQQDGQERKVILNLQDEALRLDFGDRQADLRAVACPL